MRPRKLHLLLAAALGAALPVVPAIASSEPAPAVSGLESLTWSPAQVAVAGGATVSFEDGSATVPHGVVWESGDPEAPACDGVPTEGATDWKGSCTFTKAGVYRYYCSVHGMAMSGTIEVSAPATAPSPPAPTAPGGTGSAPSPPATTGEPPTGATPASPLAGGSSSAIAIARAQRGKSVRGSIELSSAGAGARLEVELLASGAALGHARHSAPVRVGRVVRFSLKPGRVSFAASLSGSGRRALRRDGRLALTVRIALTPARGAAVSVTRLVVVRASSAPHV